MSAPLVHVVDDDDSMRKGLERLLRAEGFEVRSYASASDFLSVKPAPTEGCLVLDLHMPGPSGLNLQQAVALPVVFLTGRGDIGSSVAAMKAGAVDFLTKPVQPADLVAAIRTALARGSTVAARQDVMARLATLTRREREIFDHVATGSPNKVIARALGITERTVKAHRGQMMEKMRANSVADVVRAAELARK